MFSPSFKRPEHNDGKGVPENLQKRERKEGTERRGAGGEEKRAGSLVLPQARRPGPRGWVSASSRRCGHQGDLCPFLPAANSQGVVPGIVGAVVVAVAGAISSFIAYQKKKLCFKENGRCPPAGRRGLAKKK